MTIELTEKQQQAVCKGEVVRLPAPEIGEDVVLLRAAAYEELREILEAEQEQKALAQVGLQAAARWAQENPY